MTGVRRTRRGVLVSFDEVEASLLRHLVGEVRDLLDPREEPAVAPTATAAGLPTDADMVADARFLPNPYWIPELRPHTGLDEEVREYVLAQQGATGRTLDALDFLIAPSSRRAGSVSDG